MCLAREVEPSGSPCWGETYEHQGVAESATLTLKSDQAPALVELLKDVRSWRVKRSSQATTTLVHSLTLVSTSNGYAERGVHNLRLHFQKPQM